MINEPAWIYLRKGDSLAPLSHLNTKGPPISARKPDKMLITPKKSILFLMNFTFPVSYRLNMKESEMIDK